MKLLLNHPNIDIRIQDSVSLANYPRVDQYRLDCHNLSSFFMLIQGGNTALSITEDEDILQLLQLSKEAGFLCVRDQPPLP